MGEVIHLEKRMAPVPAEGEPAEHDLFLFAEGLQLLADFRSIPDPNVRRSICAVTAQISAALRNSSEVV